MRTGKTCATNEANAFMEIKAQIKLHLRNCSDESMKIFLDKKIQYVEEVISRECSEENIRKVKECLQNLQSGKGTFSQNGMWKLKSKLCPRPQDPPTAKLDKQGRLVSCPDKLLSLYSETYTERLSHRKMISRYEDVFHLKNQLWDMRFNKCIEIKTENWNRKNLISVLKSLKNNKARDPIGMVKDIFKPRIIGEDLELSTLDLMNSIKSESHVPTFMRLANVSSIYKKKGSNQDLENDRGIFVLGVLRGILDKLLYQDLYPEIEANMSNSNIGALRNKNVRNHLFVVYGIINSVVRGKSRCIDIQIFDIIKCFDSLWLEDVMNDLFDSVPTTGQNDKLAMVYKTNCENYVSIKTSVGQTSRTNLPKIVMQGGSWGPMQCSNSVDKIGKECEIIQEHLYSYKNLVNVPILSMVDDMLAISNCGQESVSMNTYINTHVELKKLKLHTPDLKGKTKCHRMHVGSKNQCCPELRVHDTIMQTVSEETYLGDVI